MKAPVAFCFALSMPTALAGAEMSAKGLLDACKANDPERRSYCLGYLNGVAAVTFYNCVGGGSVLSARTTGISDERLIEALAAFVESGAGEIPAWVGGALALTEAFPCNPRNGGSETERDP